MLGMGDFERLRSQVTPDSNFTLSPLALEEYRFCDQQLQDIQSKVQYLRLLEPENVKSAGQSFLASPDQDPIFTYKPIPYDISKTIEALTGIAAPGHNPIFDYLISASRRKIQLELEHLQVRGERSEVMPISIALYGRPNTTLVSLAK